MAWQYTRAENGNVALTAEIDLARCGGEFRLALGFDYDPVGAAHHARASLLDGCLSKAPVLFVSGPWRTWRSWHRLWEERASEYRVVMSDGGRVTSEQGMVAPGRGRVTPEHERVASEHGKGDAGGPRTATRPRAEAERFISRPPRTPRTSRPRPHADGRTRFSNVPISPVIIVGLLLFFGERLYWRFVGRVGLIVGMDFAARSLIPGQSGWVVLVAGQRSLVKPRKSGRAAHLMRR